MEPELRRIAAGADRSHRGAGRGDLAQELAFELSSRTLGLFLGLPDEDRPRWLAWVKRMHASVHDLEDARRATREFWDYVEGVIAERTRQPGSDFASFLLSAEIDGERLDDTEIRDFVHMTIMAGFETNAGAMGLTLLGACARSPSALSPFSQIRTSCLPPSKNSCASPRRFSCSVATRRMMCNCGDGGFRRATSWPWTASANRDPEAFEQPDECILERSPNRHLAFGFGPHLCLGAWVARLELRVLLEEVARRMPDFHVTPGATIVRKARGDQIAIESLPVTVGPAVDA